MDQCGYYSGTGTGRCLRAAMKNGFCKGHARTTTCPSCRGYGSIVQRDTDGTAIGKKPCPACNKRGTVPKSTTIPKRGT